MKKFFDINLFAALFLIIVFVFSHIWIALVVSILNITLFIYTLIQDKKNQPKFKIGDKAYKPIGYKYPCTIIAVFKNTDGNIRVVGELDGYKRLTIFKETDLELIKK